ncbi:MAG: TusE/DsrC/DsvC family sulfur relay protein, partial [Gammaproteobacteria bacterium]|nr:TusE/DsrC/DsvC family sulfur relay protein [Gammaproteobacteria bacterium]
MQSLEVNSVGYELTTDGRLKNPEGWNEEVAEALANADGLVLTNEHWDVIQVMRKYYKEYNIPPIRKLLKKALAERYTHERAQDEYLQGLFPNDVLIQGTRIAGLPASLLDAELDRTISSTGRKEHHKENTTSFNQEFEFNGRLIKIYPHGNLVNQDDWNEQLAEYLAEKEGITLTEEHWEVVRFLRKFYFEYGIAPMVKLLMKYMKEKLGGQKGSRSYLYGLFPGGPARQGSLIAG